jgi:flagellar basal-body rod protein FlgB
MAGLRLFSFTQQLLELSMRIRGARHEVLSANIANADTPGYHPKDVDFASIIQSVVEADDYPPVERERRLEAMANLPLDLHSAAYEPAVFNNKQGEDRLDGNSVSLDRQMALLTENSLIYEANLTLLSRTLAGLRYVIGEGRR